MKIISAETYQDSSVKSTNSREHVSLLVFELNTVATMNTHHHDE